MSKVRLLVGKGNQNKDANLSFAKQIKAVADKMYPGLIKDIYMGKGAWLPAACFWSLAHTRCPRSACSPPPAP